LSQTSRQVRYYQMLLIASAILLIIWQVSIVGSKVGVIQQNPQTPLLSFTTNDGSTVTLPDSAKHFTIVIFWKAASERSLLLISEALDTINRPQIDSLATLYLVDLVDSLSVAQGAVDFNNLDLPFAYSPTGTFLEQNPIRSLPCTVIFQDDGSVLQTVEGYEEGQMKEIANRLEMRNRITGKDGKFQFQFGGGKIK
jgi:hypothetical protein